MQNRTGIEHYLNFFDHPSTPLSHLVTKDSLTVYSNGSRVDFFDLTVPPEGGFNRDYVYVFHGNIANDVTALSNVKSSLVAFNSGFNPYKERQAVLWLQDSIRLTTGFTASNEKVQEGLNVNPRSVDVTVEDGLLYAMDYLDHFGVDGTQTIFLVLKDSIRSDELPDFERLTSEAISRGITVYITGSVEPNDQVRDFADATGGMMYSSASQMHNLNSRLSYFYSYISQRANSFRIRYPTDRCPTEYTTTEIHLESFLRPTPFVVHGSIYPLFDPLSLNSFEISLDKKSLPPLLESMVPVYLDSDMFYPVQDQQFWVEFTTPYEHADLLTFDVPGNSVFSGEEYDVDGSGQSLTVRFERTLNLNTSGLLGYLRVRPKRASLDSAYISIDAQWLQAGTNECIEFEPATTNIPIYPEPEVLPEGPTTICRGDVVRLNVTPGYTRFLWSTGSTRPFIDVTETGDYYVTAWHEDDFSGQSDTVHVEVYDMLTPEILGATEDLLCDGDTLWLQVDSVYISYSWSHGFDGQRAPVTESGQYWVEVYRHGACGGRSDTLEIEFHPRLIPRYSVYGNDTICGDGQVQLYAKDSTNLRWSTGETTALITVTEPGTYYYETESANGCPARSDDIVIAKRPMPAPNIIGPPAVCLNSTVIYRVEEELFDAAYRWEAVGGIFIGRNDTRNVEIQWIDSLNTELRVSQAYGPCEGESVLPISVQPVWTPQVSRVGSTIACEGDTIELHAASGYASYNWSDGRQGETIIVTGSGLYTVTVDDGGGCIGTSDPVEISFLPAPETPTVTREGAALKSSEAHRYQWYRNDELLHGETKQEYIPALSGSYHVVVSNREGCSVASEPFILIINSAENIPQSIQTLVIYPDPTSTTVTVSLPEGLREYQLQVLDMLGRTVYSIDGNTDQAQVHIPAEYLAPGMYVVRVLSGKDSWNGRFVKR